MTSTHNRPLWRRSLVKIPFQLLALYLILMGFFWWMKLSLVFPGPPPGLMLSRDDIVDVNVALDHSSINGWWLKPPIGWTPQDGAILFSHDNGGHVAH